VDVGDQGQPSRGFFERAVALALVASLTFAALTVLAPFALILLWALFIAVTLWPLHLWIAARFGGRAKLAAGATVLLLVVVLVIPLGMGVAAVVPSVRHLADSAADFPGLKLPPPPEWLRQIPVVGQSVPDTWAAVAQDAGRALETYRGDVAKTGGWLVSKLLGLGLTLVQLLLAVVISWPMLAGGANGVRLARQFAGRVGGPPAEGLLDQAARTIRSVSVGVVGTALMLAGLQTAGLYAARVPLAPLLGVASFVLATAQLGTSVVWVGAAAWLALDGHPTRATLTVVWGLLINNAIDGVVKAFLIRRGTGLPLTVIFLGVVGGLLSWGFVGVFLGPTLLGVTWTLFRGWLAASSGAEPAR